MKLVTMILTVMSLAACQIGGHEASKAKSTPEEIIAIGKHGLLSGPHVPSNEALEYVWAKAESVNEPPQYFVIRRIVRTGSIVKVRVRAVDKNLMPLSENDCIDRFIASDEYHQKRSFKSRHLHIDFKKKDITSTITGFHYSKKDASGVDLKYHYIEQRGHKPDSVDLSADHYERLTEGEYCD